MDTQVDQAHLLVDQPPAVSTRADPFVSTDALGHGGGWSLLGSLPSFLVWQWVSLTKSRSPSALTRQEERAGWLMVLPWVLGFVLFMLGPIVLSLLLSVARWKGIDTLGTAEFVGLGNYREILGGSASTFWQSLKVTVYYAVLSVPLGQGFALLAR